MNTLRHTLQFENRQRLAWLLAALCVFLIGCYLYFVNVTIFEAVAKTRMQDRIDVIYSGVLEFESTYLQAVTKVDLRLAKARGFENVAENRLHYVTSLGTALSYVPNEN